MAQRSALVLAFALALAGSSALAAGWRTTPDVTRPAPQALPSGRWTLSATGVLTWTIDPSASEVPVNWYVEHSRQIQEIQRDIDCQISACGQP